MNELANTRTGGMTVLEDLAVQAQMFSTGAAMNLLQLGRVLSEAKPLVAHGDWAAWVKENAHMPIRTAQQYMQAYQEFGLDQRYAQLGPSKVIKLLPMSEEEREELLKENDLEAMSVREVEKAVQGKRGKAGRKEQAGDAEQREALDREREAMRAETEALREQIRAEAMAEAESRMVAEEAARIRAERKQAEAEMEQIRAEVMADAKEALQEAMDAQRRLAKENADLQRENREQAEMLNEQQEELNRTQTELLNARSAMAKGDAERIPASGLTVDGFAQAVRGFIGTVARMPQMRNAFAGMAHEERQEYSELLETVEKWCADSRKALDSTFAEGMVV